jgi:signal peptidase I
MSDPPGAAPEAEEGARPDARRQRASFLREIPVLIVVALGVALVIKAFLLQAFYIPSESMEPTLYPGDRIIVIKPGGFDRQDVVVFENPNLPDESGGLLSRLLDWLGDGLGFAGREDEHLIKRVIGMPGDTVEIREQRVILNGTELSEPYLTPEARACNAAYPPTEVPAGRIWVLGDNRCHSGDSRFGLGFVPADDVVGRAVVVVWPPSRVGAID